MTNEQMLLELEFFYMHVCTHSMHVHIHVHLGYSTNILACKLNITGRKNKFASNLPCANMLQI